MLQRILEIRASDDDDIALGRRRFIRQVACGSLLTLGTPILAEAAKGRFPVHKTLLLKHAHTGDKIKLTYFEKGRYLKDALHEVNLLFRDHRNGNVHPIDVTLLDQLYDIKQLLGVNRPIQVVCGYRSPFTNAIMHEQNSGVASNSLHMQGRAVDIRIEGCHTRQIRNAALALRQGGVGYYEKSDFVHLDTGKFRAW